VFYQNVWTEQAGFFDVEAAQCYKEILVSRKSGHLPALGLVCVYHRRIQPFMLGGAKPPILGQEG